MLVVLFQIKPLYRAKISNDPLVYKDAQPRIAVLYKVEYKVDIDTAFAFSLSLIHLHF